MITNVLGLKTKHSYFQLPGTRLKHKTHFCKIQIFPLLSVLKPGNRKLYLYLCPYILNIPYSTKRNSTSFPACPKAVSGTILLSGTLQVDPSNIVPLASINEIYKYY